MGFNIKDLLGGKKFISPEKAVLLEVLSEYIPEISEKNIILSRGVLSIKNISPIKKTHIKRHGVLIRKKLQEKELLVRDII